ncbi:hypothetical protein SLNWT_1816 [Streptomyces albus]|uniref:Uncharacterized protein n=1 Tax=Streptomyces albus (strain ATCC 21838 / DSM 41398 / FERM P-419 / JCM 4703 / NBRC 107858) TaxID=1081613 RepID=A0A0B5EVM7_STRA4|nr:hypothetical protein SLNWT_1816 [Streptomyces albus]AOU76507.1 hypothetical protein SLNHY_1816 [Streptomyces albus]
MEGLTGSRRVSGVPGVRGAGRPDAGDRWSLGPVIPGTGGPWMSGPGDPRVQDRQCQGSAGPPVRAGQ